MKKQTYGLLALFLIFTLILPYYPGCNGSSSSSAPPPEEVSSEEVYSEEEILEQAGIVNQEEIPFSQEDLEEMASQDERLNDI